MKAFLALLSTFVFFACGSEETKAPSRKKVVNSSELTLRSCSGADIQASAGLGKGYSFRDGNEIKVTSSEQEKETLCQIMDSEGWELAVFQLAGVTCTTCQDDAEEIAKLLSAKHQKVGHAVILTDFFDDYDDSDYQGFMERHASKALRLHDIDAQLWKSLSLDPNKPTRPTVLVFHKAGLAFLSNKEGNDNEMIEKALTKIEDSIANPNSDKKIDPRDNQVDPLVIDFNIVTNQGEKNLSDVFTKKYAVIDLSQLGCGPCRDTASDKNSDKEFQKSITEGSCDFMIFVGERDLSGWHDLFSPSTFSGGRSYSGGRSAVDVAKKFSFNLTATPTFLVVDRAGKVLDSSTGGMSAKAKSLCAEK